MPPVFDGEGLEDRRLEVLDKFAGVKVDVALEVRCVKGAKLFQEVGAPIF